MFTADPRRDDDASLIEEIVEVDAALEAVAGGAGTERGQRRNGEQARGREDRGVVGRARGDRVGRARRTSSPTRSPGTPVGTSFAPRVAAAAEPQALDRVRAGRPRAGSSSTPARGARSSSGGKSLLAAGVRGVEGDFDADAAVEIVDERRRGVRQGPVPLRVRAARARVAGRRTADLPEGLPHEVVHRDDLVVLPLTDGVRRGENPLT